MLKLVLWLPAVDYLDPSHSQDPPLTPGAAILSLKKRDQIWLLRTSLVGKQDLDCKAWKTSHWVLMYFRFVVIGQIWRQYLLCEYIKHLLAEIETNYLIKIITTTLRKISFSKQAVHKNSTHKGSSGVVRGKRRLLVPIPLSIPAFYADVLGILSRVPSEDCVTSHRSSALEATPNSPRSRELALRLQKWK